MIDKLEHVLTSLVHAIIFNIVRNSFNEHFLVLSDSVCCQTLNRFQYLQVTQSIIHFPAGSDASPIWGCSVPTSSPHHQIYPVVLLHSGVGKSIVRVKSVYSSKRQCKANASCQGFFQTGHSRAQYSNQQAIESPLVLNWQYLYMDLVAVVYYVAYFIPLWAANVKVGD